MAKSEDKSHGKNLLDLYLEGGKGKVFGQLAYVNTSGNYHNSFYQVLAIDDKGRRIVNISLYVAQATGLRRNKDGAILVRGSFQDIVEEIQTAMGWEKLPYERL